jgi:hypothetical protein
MIDPAARGPFEPHPRTRGRTRLFERAKTKR